MSINWQTHHSPQHKPYESDPVAPWKTYLGEVCPHGREIILVDGTHVRDTWDSDFSQGGNGYRYRFVPRGELWIDAQISQTEWPLIAFHECYESELMKKGIDYDHAHSSAKRLEDKFRRGRTP